MAVRHLPRVGVAACLIAVGITPAKAQQTLGSAADSLRLSALHQEAIAKDPRQRQFELLAKQTGLRLRNLSAERLPSISAQAQAQYQSEVFTAPSQPGGGTVFPSPSKDSYDGHVSVEQAIVDPTIGVRQQVERAQLAESEAEVRTALFDLRREVNDAFFSAALLAERRRLIGATIADLEKQLEEARVRVREGAALPSDTAAIQATLLERQQDDAEVDADRQAALVRLTELVKRPVSGADPFALPDLTAATTQARQGLDSLRIRPEYEQFARTREVLARQQQQVSADQKPRLSAFGEAGYGRPGLNPVSESFDSYYLAGVKVRWAPWNWGSSSREREALAIQREIVASEEAAFTSRLTRDVQNDLADIDRLDAALALDDQIVSLRERVDAETAARFREGVVTASEYVDRSTDVLEARLARATHRVEQVQARARFLTSLGLEIQ
ncbi:MAG TPA: TolC family protein [Gemmatimonadales bacterium]|nr:TolC family protein [Gemmatimonadales bacterium]